MMKRFIHDLVASIVLGPVTAVIVISYASLIYAGFPAAFAARGIGFALFGCVLFNLTFARFTSFPGMAIYPQDNPAVILGLVTTSILGVGVASMPVENLFATVVAATVASSLLTAAFFLLLGIFRLGNLVRYLPYPVVGGFLAGTGSLMVQGAIRSMTGIQISLGSRSTLFAPELLIRWLPGLALGLILLVLLRRYTHFLLLPGILVTAIGLFYLTIWATGNNLDGVHQQGWLLGPFPNGALWQPPTLALLRQVDWQMLRSQGGTIVALPLICTVSMLLNGSGLEIVRQRDLNVNHELRLAGLANLLAAVGGSHVGYPSMSMSTLAHKMGAAGRTTSLLIGLICGAALFYGASVLSYLPKWVLGGVVIYIGFGFLTNWVYDTWFRMSRTDYLVVWSILIAMNGFGVLEGVGLGIGLAVILFVIEYSRIKVVKHSLSGAGYRSTVDRPQHQQMLLRRRGSAFHIFELQGFIFFGRSNQLVEEVRQRIEDPNLPSLALRFWIFARSPVLMPRLC